MCQKSTCRKHCTIGTLTVLSVRPSVCLCTFVCVCVCVYVCLSVCLCASVYIWWWWKWQRGQWYQEGLPTQSVRLVPPTAALHYLHSECRVIRSRVFLVQIARKPVNGFSRNFLGWLDSDADVNSFFCILGHPWFFAARRMGVSWDYPLCSPGGSTIRGGGLKAVITSDHYYFYYFVFFLFQIIFSWPDFNHLSGFFLSYTWSLCACRHSHLVVYCYRFKLSVIVTAE